jgi:PAS domain S-box-containing protein
MSKMDTRKATILVADDAEANRTLLWRQLCTPRAWDSVSCGFTEFEKNQSKWRTGMRESRERFQVLFENNPHPTWVYDVETIHFLEVNKAAVEKYGYSRDEFLAMRITDIRPPEDVGPLLEDLKKERPVRQSSERRHRCKDGRVIQVAVSSHLAELKGRRVAVVVAEDITERKRTEEALVRAKEEAERATHLKDQFLSTMSHELRTPLNAILGFSELLSDERYGSLNDRQRRYIDHIHTSGRHLLRLINDILDLSKIEAGRFELAIESVRVDYAFDEVLSVMGPLAEKKSQTLSHLAEAGLSVRADATRLKQVLVNLVGNAIKFTPEGGRVELTACREDGQVRMEVRDTGPGIPAEEQKRIFEAFYRLRISGEATEGTGLGLAITQRLVELHGGQLGLESQLGEGSCFYFSLPFAAEISDPLSQGIESGQRRSKPSRILVIEDDPASKQLIQSQLTSSGGEVVLCDQPQHAVEMAAKLQPDAITLDLLMKPTSGWEILSQLKGDPRTGSIPVIVVTILDQPAVGAILGADEYLVKPVEKAALLGAVERCMKRGGAAPPKRPILVVEDDAPTREVITELLTARGYSVTTAVDGAQARASVAHLLPELVILDLLLPKVSGFELLSEWRAGSRTADLPVFVLTSKDLSRQEEKYLRAHAEFLYHKQQPWQEALIKQLLRVAPLQRLESA